MESATSASIPTVLLTTISAFLGALVSHFLTQRRGLDLAVYKHRGEVYKLLWQKTSLLPNWPRRKDVTYALIRALSVELRTWYFEVGGVYLSDPARKAYGNLQTVLNKFETAPDSETLATEHYDLLRDRCSDLRSELTHDLLSRKRMLLVSR